jgi:stage V sporulation protein R
VITDYFFDMTIPLELARIQETIEEYARDYGLDFLEIRYQMLDYKMINLVAAYDGFPTRYPHWRFGMEYERMSKSFAYGLHRIYEMVINTDPVYAYLLQSNLPVDQKLVMAHVCGHADFFKNNMWFAHTNRKMLDEVANHASRLRRYIGRYGLESVENFLDACLSLDNLIDIHAPGIRRRPRFVDPNDEEDSLPVHRIKAKEYMDEYINPPEFLAAQQEKREQERERRKNFPEQPERDVLLFLMEHGPLENWQRDVLAIVREEAYYFAPQRQTKIMNEGWACAVGETLVRTNRGLLRLDEIVQNQLPVQVCDGESLRVIYDYARLPVRETIRIRTRRGFVLEGAKTHRILQKHAQWRRLDELRIGDEIELARGTHTWASQYYPLEWSSPERLTLQGVAELADVSVSTVIRRRHGRNVELAQMVDKAIALYEEKIEEHGLIQPIRRKEITIPLVVTEELGEFLGLLTGDGHISEVKRVLGLASSDLSQAERFLELAKLLFNLEGKLVQDGNRYRANIYSKELAAFLMSLGISSGPAASQKQIPSCILQSPESVIGSFLRGLFDADGYAGNQGVILSSSSEALSQTVQEILMNMGILSRRRLQRDACWHVHIAGSSAQLFEEYIGFGLPRKQAALNEYVSSRQWFKAESWHDEVVEISFSQREVYDISVEGTHRYAAAGFVNHNSFWHSTIMTQKALEPDELIDYAEHHSGTVAAHNGRLNPYRLGLLLLKDIEDRWNRGAFGPEYEQCDDYTARQNWDKKLGLGREKLFEVRRIYNDVGFIDAFLTEDFVRQHKLFSYDYNKLTNLYEISSRDFQEIKHKLLFQLTNFGQPLIDVVEANMSNRGELLLRHRHEGIDLDVPFAEETLKNLYLIWGRPVHLETAVADEGAFLFSHGPDGGSHERI